jgi:drug/metabolite transporter (DMT)-like permease
MLNSQDLRFQDDWYNQRMPDGGPVYTETNAEQFIMEPWNAVSSLLIVVPAIYWLFRIRKELKDYKFLLYCIPLMILGGTGSTLFHALRASQFFLIMDVLPTAVLTFSLMIYFWLKVFNRWWYIFFIIAGSIGIRFLFWGNLPDFLAINISYAITGILIGLPLLISLRKSNYYKLNYVIISILFFIIAILFRDMDSREISFLPMGTHFLWHAFTGFGAWFILAYLYFYRNRELSLLKNK